MKTIVYTVFLLSLLCIDRVNVHAQGQFGYTLNAGIGDWGAVHPSEKILFSANAGFFYKLQFHQKWFAGSELVMSYVGNKDKRSINCPRCTFYVEPHARNVRTHHSDLNLPLFIGYRIKRFGISVGPMLSTALVHRVSGELVYKNDGSREAVNYQQDGTFSSLIDQMRLGTYIGFSYGLSERLDIRLTSYSGPTERPAYDVFNQTLIGISHTIIPSKNKKKEAQTKD